MNRYFYCNQKTSDNFTAVLVHVKSGYLPPVDFNTVQTEKPQAAKPAFFVDLHGGLDFCQNIGDKSLVKQIESETFFAQVFERRTDMVKNFVVND